MLAPSQNRAAGYLTQSLNDRASSDKDFQATLALDQYAQQREQEKQIAAAQEQQYYNLINEKADKLLGYDRERIQERANQFYHSTREKVKLYGGDLKRYMSNGGSTQMNQFTGQILNSKEFNTYRNNKENLTRIMDIQEKGLGHLLLKRDVDSLQNYQQNKGGEITYNGMMTEIELPDPNNYDLGADVPINDIISHKENYMRLVGNYTMHYPDLPPPDINDLKAFVTEMGYGLKGSNREKERFLKELALKKAGQTVKEPKADDRPIDGLTEMTKVIQTMPAGMTAEQFYDEDTWENNNYFEDQASQNKYLASFVSQNKWNAMARNVNLDENSFFDFGDKGSWATKAGVTGAYDRIFKDMFKLANASRILEGFESTVAEAALSTKLNEDGTIDFEPTQDMYRMDGTEISGSETLEPGAYAGKYRPIGIATGTITKNGKGKPQLLMTVHDDNGKLDKKQTKKFVDDVRGNEVRPGVLLALQNEEGNIFYREIDLKQSLLRSKIKEHGGEAWLLNDEVEASQRQADEQAVAQRGLDQAQQQYRQYAATVDSVLEENNSFLRETKDFSSRENPQLNRSSLMKSFYAVRSNFGDPTSLVQTHAFSKLFDPELVKMEPDLGKVKSMFQSFEHGMNDTELIDLWLKAVNKEMNADVRSKNTLLAERWKYMLQQYNELN